MPKGLERRSFFGWMAGVPAALAATQVAEAAAPLARLQEPPPPTPTEKDLKELQDQVRRVREAKLPQAVEPAFAFAALKRVKR